MKCIESYCNANAEESDGRCNRHYYFHIWLDNKDRDNLGIVRFAQDVVPDWLRQETPEFHKDVFNDFMQLYSPKREDKYDRLLAEIAFRGAAKTTRAKIILLYVCSLAIERFVVYCSETGDFAKQDVSEVQRELQENQRIKHYFGPINSKAVKGNDGQWIKGAFMTVRSRYLPKGLGVFVLSRGVGQQVRSALRNSFRPTLALINDMDSKDTVKTEIYRAGQQLWFFRDMFNAIDDIDGKVFFNGTILHEDTVPVKLMNNPQWKVHLYPVMDIDDFHAAVKECTHISADDKVILGPREKIDEFEKKCKLAWASRLSLNYILKKYQEAYQSQQLPGFYQEYFHITTPPGEKMVTVIQYANVRFFRTHMTNWIGVTFGDGPEVVYNVNVFAGIDPASSISAMAKPSVICYIAINAHRQVFVLGYSRGKYGNRDELHPGVVRPNGDMVIPDRSKVLRIGIVDEEIRLAKQFGFYAVTIETTQHQQSVYDEVLRLMRLNGAFHQVFGEKPNTEKTERDSAVLSPYFQTKSIFLQRDQVELVRELNAFPRGQTIDIIDALYYAVKNARPPQELTFSDVKGKRFKKDNYIRDFSSL